MMKYLVDHIGVKKIIGKRELKNGSSPKMDIFSSAYFLFSLSVSFIGAFNSVYFLDLMAKDAKIGTCTESAFQNYLFLNRNI
jgi:hypothetical protein